jgi:hypothetical protein
MTVLEEPDRDGDSPLDWELEMEKMPLLILFHRWVFIIGLGVGAIGLAAAMTCFWAG